MYQGINELHAVEGQRVFLDQCFLLASLLSLV